MSAKLFFGLTALAVMLGPAGAYAADPAEGIWMDHTGRGAVEIKACGGKLCGHVVWVKDKTDKKKGCGLQILGDLSKESSKSWGGGGWVYSPERKRKYDVELTPLDNGTLRVLGYAGSKIFSKTMIWTRPEQDLMLCQSEPKEAAAQPAATSEAQPPATASGTPPASTNNANASAPDAQPGESKPAETATPVPLPESEQDEAKAGNGDIGKPDPGKGATEAAEKPESQAKTGKPNEIAAAEQKPKVKKRFKDEEEDEDEDDDSPVKKELCTLKVPYVTIKIPCPD